MSDPARQHHFTALIQEALNPAQPVPTLVEPRLPRLQGIRWVVFDVYGTLLTSSAGEISIGAGEEQRSRPFRAVLRWCREAFPERPPASLKEEEWARAFYDLIGKEHAAKRSKDVPQPEVDIRRIWQSLLTDMEVLPRKFADTSNTATAAEEAALRFELAVNPVWPMPGSDEILRRLRDGPYRSGIISNAQFYTPLCIEQLFRQSLGDLGFAVTTWSYREGIAKPSPALFRIFLDRARALDGDLRGEEILYIGNDIRNDIAPARELGFRTALFAGDKRSLRLRRNDPELARVTPDVVLTDLGQLKYVLFPEGPDIVHRVTPRKGSSL
jgi:putative hydrolase of the HAD superfamily